MIYKSYKWKKELRHQKKEILRFNRKEFFDDDFDVTYFKIEKAFLFSTIIMRTLLEAQKLSDFVDNYQIKVSKNKPKRNIDRLHRFLDDDEYDWKHTDFEKLSGRKICNFILHSYVFSFLFENNDSIIGFCVSSDYDRNKFLYTIELNDWFDFMNIIITDAVVATKLLANEKNYDYEYIEMKRGKHRVLKP